MADRSGPHGAARWYLSRQTTAPEADKTAALESRGPLCALQPSLKPRPGSLPFTLCMLLRYDNIAVRYITPAHGVYHSGRHFMLHNHPIYISLCIKVFTHGLVKSALPHYQRTPAEGKRHSGSSDCHPYRCESLKNMRLPHPLLLFSNHVKQNLTSLHLTDGNHLLKHSRST